MMVKRALELYRISISRLRAFNSCRRLHHYQYTLRYRPLVDRESAEFGTILHKGLEAWWLAWAEGRELMSQVEAHAAIAKAVQASSYPDEATATKAALLMDAYHYRYAPEMGQWEVIAVERKFETPMPTPAGAKRVRGLKVVGKVDLLVRKRSDDTVWIVEHKTTTADLTPGSTYWQRLRMDGQVSVYFEGARALGLDPVGCLYDVIGKPQQRPLKATPEDQRKFTKEGKLYAKQRLADETMEEFRARMVALIAESPDDYLKRNEVVRLEEELEESRRDTYETALMIRETKRAERAPRNPDACMTYGSICKFYDVCTGIASIDDPTRFKRMEDPHPELANDNSGDGKAA